MIIQAHSRDKTDEVRETWVAGKSGNGPETGPRIGLPTKFELRFG